jgi:hypothetical protein
MKIAICSKGGTGDVNFLQDSIPIEDVLEEKLKISFSFV